MTGTVIGEAGDCELEEVEAVLLCRGLRAQADFFGGWG